MLEILAPAGNFECAEAAIDNGANAIYLGLSAFSARQGAENFDEESFCALLQRAHFCGTKVYVALNTIVKNTEVDDFLRALISAWNFGADAIILQDAMLGRLVHKIYPQIVLHLSTQAGVCNVQGARFAKESGFSRVILARETPLKEIKKITEIIETEVFVQGALCTCFSGQCFFSSFAGGNSGNRGRCKQPCRKLYAYDRNKNTEKNYALSLSDLCVGEEISKLIEAGVISFKIEGRMRRPEYVAAAVRYYRSGLDGQNTAQKLSDLKRTYNRGNYTRGLAFGQDKRFLSTAIQGHIGEKVGVVKVVNGNFLVESVFKPRQGDAFKILRDGKEIGGAIYLRSEGRSFSIRSKLRLKNGDGVFITTDTAVAERVLQAKKQGEIHLSLYFKEGERAVMSCGNIKMLSPEPLLSANSRPLTKTELESCFLKTDALPVRVVFDEVIVEGNIFIARSELNALRRNFYSEVAAFFGNGNREAYDPFKPLRYTPTGANLKTAVIADSFDGVFADVAIYKPNDFNAPLPDSFKNGNFEKYLYYPAFLTGKDVEALEKLLVQTNFSGIYAENYGGFSFAKERGLRLFAGVGFHVMNGVSLSELLSDPIVAYYAISKEANAKEAEELVGEKAFILSSGGIKLMDLIYCPFGKTCSVCDKKDCYTLTDEGGREFPVKRYLSAEGACRFEVYNCADLIGVGVPKAGRLMDLTLVSDKRAAALAHGSEEQQKKIYKKYTSGHLRRGVL